MLLKRVADLLIDGYYQRITIWNVLEWKRNRPDLWEKYKNNIYSICKKPEHKVRMIFQTGKNGMLKNSYFRYYNVDYEHKGEGSEESYRHEFFKECVSRIEHLEIRWKREAITIYPDEILQEETIIMNDGSRRIVDLLVNFTKSQPAIYVEKWNGQLAIEIKDTHSVDNKKIKQLREKQLACLEFTVSKWNIREYFNSAEDEEKQIIEIAERLDGKNGGYIFGALLVDPIYRKYFSTKLLEDETREKERVITELNQVEHLYRQAIDDNKQLREQIRLFTIRTEEYKNTILNLETKMRVIERENAEIKSSFWYKLFGEK